MTIRSVVVCRRCLSITSGYAVGVAAILCVGPQTSMAPARMFLASSLGCVGAEWVMERWALITYSATRVVVLSGLFGAALATCWIAFMRDLLT